MPGKIILVTRYCWKILGNWQEGTIILYTQMLYRTKICYTEGSRKEETDFSTSVRSWFVIFERMGTQFTSEMALNLFPFWSVHCFSSGHSESGLQERLWESTHWCPMPLDFILSNLTSTFWQYYLSTPRANNFTLLLKTKQTNNKTSSRASH